MPIAKIQLPDGRIAKFEVPDGTTPEQVTAFAEQQFAPAATSARPKAENTASDSSIVALGAGLGKGFGQVALNAQRYLGKGINAAGDLISPPQTSITSLVTGKQAGGNAAGNWLVKDAERGLKKIEGELAPYKQQSPVAATAGEIGGNVIATLPVGGVLAKGAQALGAPTALTTSIATGGMRAGATSGAANMLTRMAGGGIAGGASAGLVDPESIGIGAGIGAVLPPAMRTVGIAGNAIGRTISGPAVPEGVLAAAQAGRELGYVVPPTQVRPTLLNRLVEGAAGKLTTAQNASARNQEVTNHLARGALGLAPDAPLTKEGLAALRREAGQAYEAVRNTGQIAPDEEFANALRGITAQYQGAAQSFPGLARNEVAELIDNLSVPNIDSSSAVDAIRVLRENADRAFGSGDKGLGRATREAAGALEALLERGAVANGTPGAVQAMRNARAQIARSYTVEDALNPATGSVSGHRLATAVRRGRPLDGNLRQAAQFANAFPKATQEIERMGSLPQLSPLDWSAAGIAGVASGGNPLSLLGLVARPSARFAALSGPVQNRLATPAGRSPMMNMLANPTTEQLVYRAAPVVSDR